MWRLRLKDLQRVVAVIHKVDAAPSSRDGKAKQRTCARDRIDRLDGDLRASRCRLHEIPVTAIRGDDMAVGSDRQP